MKSKYIYNIKLIKGLFVIAVVFSSCEKDFLDKEVISYADESTIFSDSLNTIGFVNSRYGDVMYSWSPKRFSNSGLEAASDEAESSVDAGSYSTKIYTGAANPSNTDKKIWDITYRQVRAINIFLANKNNIPVTDKTMAVWEGQVRFLRAWYYAALLKHYGGFPLVGDKVFNDGETIDIPRSTYEECVNYIVQECNLAASLLPITYTLNEDYGRATKGAALSLKARVLLYAASPYVNQSRADDPKFLVSYGNNDNSRWKKAADAAQEVINLGRYSLYRITQSYFYNLFLTYKTDEQIFDFRIPSSTSNDRFLEEWWNPVSRNVRGNATGFPTQELVDAFDMSNGLPITDPASGYPGIGNDMYKNRDPRFYNTIAFNGSSRFLGGFGNQPVWTYTGVVPNSPLLSINSASRDGIYKSNATLTGYYSNKMLGNDVVPGGSILNKPLMLMRYAEILLIAAESINEFSGPSQQIYTWLTDIRQRAGIAAGSNGLYGLKANMTQDEMRKAIQHERQVELAFEEHRYWDVRRWKLAPQLFDSERHGMEITRAEDGSFSYRKISTTKMIFTEAMYFWPIPQSEIIKSPALIQNPGY